MKLKIKETTYETIIANTFFKRLKGLLGKRTLPANKAIVIYPCKAIHTWFMRFPIDCIFLNKDGEVLHVIKNMKPFRVSPVILKAYYVVEMSHIISLNISVGDKFKLMEGGTDSSERTAKKRKKSIK